MIRRLIPWTVLPLTVLATAAAVAPWLRAFPADVLAVPLFGAAALSVLVPVVAVRLVSRRLWLTVGVDVLAFVAFALLAGVRAPLGFRALLDGLVHGPSQVLTFALPLVTPHSLVVPPVALAWVAGALAGECLARRWFTTLPSFGWLLVFGLSWAGSERAAGPSSRWVGTLLAAGLLGGLLLLRAVSAWVDQDAAAVGTQSEGALPLRGLVRGAVLTVAVVLAAALGVQGSAFGGRATVAQRVPSVRRSDPVTPLAFVAGLRPTDPTAPGVPVFSVTVDRPSSGYVEIADVDYYDGDGWSFERMFRPTGGVVPDESDPLLRPTGPTLTQRYRVTGDALSSAPWLPTMYRVRQVTGTGINVDPDSGMVVPTDPVRAGESYTVRSAAATTRLTDVAAGVPATSTAPVDLEIPPQLRSQLTTFLGGLADEVNTPTSAGIGFLERLQADLRGPSYALVGSPSSSPSRSPSSSASAAASASVDRSSSTAFADVLTSIGGQSRSGTPEQYATLFALAARSIGIPARVVTGFRVGTGGAPLPAGTYQVSTAQAWTWVQIPIQGAGWVIVDPSPSGYANRQAVPSVGTQPTSSHSALPTPGARIENVNGGHAVAKPSAVPHRHALALRSVVLVLLAVALIMTLVLPLTLLARKAGRRRRRRRSGDPRGQLLGAWHETIDMVAEAGLPPLDTATSAEVAAVLRERFGDETGDLAAQLGRAANVAMYSSGPITASDAVEAWDAHRAVRRLVRRQLPVTRRVSARLRVHRSDARTPGRSARRR